MIAEISNPFIVMRTMLKITGRKNTKAYEIFQLLFAGTFLPLRMIVTPIWMIFVYEAENCIIVTKLCVSLVYFIQQFWCMRILQLVGERIKESYKKKDAPLPKWAQAYTTFFD